MSFLHVPLTDLLDAWLMMCRRGESDFTVEVEAGGLGRLVVGRIMLVTRSTGRTVWFSTITGPYRAVFRLAPHQLLEEAARAGGSRLAWYPGNVPVGGCR